MGRLRTLLVVACVGALFALEGAGPLAAQGRTPKYMNAEVVKVRVQERLLVVRDNEGAEQTMQLDDRVAGFADLRPGDQVILTVRGEPGRARVEAILKAKAPSEPAPSTETPPNSDEKPQG